MHMVATMTSPALKQLLSRLFGRFGLVPDVIQVIIDRMVEAMMRPWIQERAKSSKVLYSPAWFGEKNYNRYYIETPRKLLGLPVYGPWGD